MTDECGMDESAESMARRMCKGNYRTEIKRLKAAYLVLHTENDQRLLLEKLESAKVLQRLTDEIGELKKEKDYFKEQWFAEQEICAKLLDEKRALIHAIKTGRCNLDEMPKEVIADKSEVVWKPEPARVHIEAEGNVVVTTNAEHSGT